MIAVNMRYGVEYRNPSVPARVRNNLSKYRSLGLSGTPEYATVNTHRASIRTAYKAKNATYRNMPFFAEWEPRKGGCSAGAKWIIDNLGRKPSPDYELHIVDRTLGFVPGNLQWIPRSEHKREEMLTKVLIENRQLKDRIAFLESRQ
jgi:hypothetical protein